MSLNEQHIITAFLEGDSKAFDLIYDRYSPNLYGYIFQMVKDEAIAKDILQESLVKAWKSRAQYKPNISKLFTWLLTICRNKAIDKIRSLKKRQEHENQSVSSNVYISNKELSQIETSDLKENVSTLELKYKEVIDLLFFQGYTHVEASDELGIPLGTLKTRLKIALRELRKIYAPDTFVLLYIFYEWLKNG